MRFDSVRSMVRTDLFGARFWGCGPGPSEVAHAHPILILICGYSMDVGFGGRRGSWPVGQI